MIVSLMIEDRLMTPLPFSPQVERARRLEKAGGVDEVLLEEIREYKQQLTCSCCNVNKKVPFLDLKFRCFMTRIGSVC